MEYFVFTPKVHRLMTILANRPDEYFAPSDVEDHLAHWFDLKDLTKVQDILMRMYQIGFLDVQARPGPPPSNVRYRYKINEKGLQKLAEFSTRLTASAKTDSGQPRGDNHTILLVRRKDRTQAFPMATYVEEPSDTVIMKVTSPHRDAFTDADFINEFSRKFDPSASQWEAFYRSDPAKFLSIETFQPRDHAIGGGYRSDERSKSVLIIDSMSQVSDQLPTALDIVELVEPEPMSEGDLSVREEHRLRTKGKSRPPLPHGPIRHGHRF